MCRYADKKRADVLISTCSFWLVLYALFRNKKIKLALRELINKARETALPLKDITHVEGFVDYNESSLAFEQIVEQLYQFSIPISAELYDAAEQCGILLDMPANKYDYLQELIMEA
jgi:hypothetical protein